MTESLPIDGHSLSLDHFLAVVRGRCAVSLAPTARSAVSSARRSVERVLAQGRSVYGITTGFGALSQQVVPAGQARELQRSLVRSHSSGAGEPLEAELVLGMMLLRANSLAAAHSGVRVEVLDLILELLNRRLVPFVPRQGSVGASGDLAPLAHMSLAMMGEGAFLGTDARPQSAGPVLAANGIEPLSLQEKEGVALLNGTSLMTSYLALAIADSEGLFDAALAAAAISFDALRGDPSALDDRLGEVRNLPEQRAVAASLRALIEKSALSVARADYQGQDPYTLRCLPQVLVAVRLATQFARQILDAELNAVSDNPVMFEGDEFVNGGNFHGQTLALALDTLAIATQYLTAFSERRIARLLNPSLNRGLPAFLAPTPGLTSGWMIAQYLAAACVNENLVLSHPASTGSLPTSADQEDFVSMGPWAGAKLRRVIDNARTVVAVEWIVGAQALELRRPAHGGRGSEAGLRAIREVVAPWSADRPPSPDIEAVRARIADGSLVAKVRSDVPF
ncbi:MAG: histidine ammonia-lyase [Thermoplasmata archaeon]|nr:histidine ammonia-lyase [Thermoplasmata archaeon]MCI4359583.1 histidine ammonia-lyase [Thermoplasmata archaeon]